MLMYAAGRNCLFRRAGNAAGQEQRHDHQRRRDPEQEGKHIDHPARRRLRRQRLRSRRVDMRRVGKLVGMIGRVLDVKQSPGPPSRWSPTGTSRR